MEYSNVITGNLEESKLESCLDENIVDYLNDILVNKLEDKKPDYWTDNLTDHRVRISQKKNLTTQKIINIVKPLFENAGLIVNTDNGYIDYESYTYNSQKYVDTPYDISAEKSEYYSEEFSNVNVCYIVTRKDENLKGGNIHLYEEYPSFLQVIGYEKENFLEIKLKKGCAYIFSGDAYTKLQGCSGSGVFSFIRVTLYSEKRFGYQNDNDDDE